MTVGESTAKNPAGIPAEASTRLSRSLAVGMRFVVLLGAVSTLYLVVGSYLYGVWFFRLIWRLKILDRDFLLDGMRYWINEEFRGLIAVLAMMCLATVLVSLHKARFFGFIDRFRGWLLFSFTATITFTALFDYHLQREPAERWERVEDAFGELKTALLELDALGSNPAIEGPIDFQYLDRERVEALYNQLEPELIEKQRTVAADEKLHGKASLGAGPSGAEVGAEKGQTSTSSYERTKFSPERKCVEVMKFTLDNHRLAYYTSGSDWFMRRISQALREHLAQLGSSEPLDMRKLKPIEPIGPKDPTKREDSGQRLKEYEGEFAMPTC